MLSIKHVSKIYNKVYANNDVSMEIEDGNIVVLLGPNGAGKSTLIKCIIGLLKYTGSIEINGNYNKTVEAKRITGYIPEIPALYPNLTVNEHLEFIAKVYKLKDYQEYKNELLTRFELMDKKDKFGDELSKGMRQKLNICCGLLSKPKVVLFDEPMIGLDPHSIKELKKIFKELKDSGGIVFISTHMIDSIKELWDVTYIMQDGCLKAEVRREGLENSEESLEDIFFSITEGKEE